MSTRASRMKDLMVILDRTDAKVVKSRRPRSKYNTPGNPKLSKKKSIKRSMKMNMKSSAKCQKLLAKKIGINMGEYRQGRYTTPKQAIAVAYSQVKKDHPTCKGPITKSRNKSMSKKSRRPLKKSKSKRTKKSVRR